MFDEKRSSFCTLQGYFSNWSMSRHLDNVSRVRESSFNMTRGGGGMKILRGGSENF